MLDDESFVLRRLLELQQANTAEHDVPQVGVGFGAQLQQQVLSHQRKLEQRRLTILFCHGSVRINYLYIFCVCKSHEI